MASELTTPTDGQPLVTFAITCRLGKTFFGMPRKCGNCQKTIVFTAGYACQFCSFRCHRKCAENDPELCGMTIGEDGACSPTTSFSANSSGRRRLCSLSRVPTGDTEAFSKLLRTANDLSNNSVDIYPEQWWTTAVSSSSTHNFNSHHTNQMSSPVESLYAESALSAPEFISSSCESVVTLTSGDEQLSPAPHDYATPHHRRHSPRRPTDMPSLVTQAVKALESNATPPAEPDSMMARIMKLWPWGGREVEVTDTLQGTAATPIDNYNARMIERMLAKASIASSMSGSLADSAISSYNGPSLSVNSRTNARDRRLTWVRLMAGERGAYSQDYGTVSDFDCCTPVMNHRPRYPSENTAEVGVQSLRYANECLSSSWPLIGLHLNLDDGQQVCSAQDISSVQDQFSPVRFAVASDDEDEADLRIDKQHRQAMIERTKSHPANSKGAHESFRDLGEWSIPFNDLSFGECVFKGRLVETYKGRWHGEVMIHTYDHSHLERFLKDVHTLTKIRHENIALFMGACMEPPNLAVVTSIRKKERLYDAIHERKRRFSYQQKLHVARQITQGIGYLHAKGIMLRCLTSRSIYLDGKVKICTVDYGGPYACRASVNVNSGCLVSRHQLTALSPELMRSLRIEPPTLRLDARHHTKASDVYSFGTIMYEMFAGEHPFPLLSAQSIVYLIGSGQHECLNNVQCAACMRALIEQCWQVNPMLRPSVADMLVMLNRTIKQLTQITVSSSIRHLSNSEPEQLNRLGLPKRPTMPSLQPITVRHCGID